MSTMIFDALKIQRHKNEAKRNRIPEKVRLILRSHEFKHCLDGPGVEYRVNRKTNWSYDSGGRVVDAYDYDHCEWVKIPGDLTIFNVNAPYEVNYQGETVFSFRRREILSYAPDSAWLVPFNHFANLAEVAEAAYLRDQEIRKLKETISANRAEKENFRRKWGL